MFRPLLPTLLVALSLSIASCKPTEASEESTTEVTAKYSEQMTSTDYKCGEQQITFIIQGETADLRIANVTYAMQPAVSASGSKYEALGEPETFFWSKGDEATLGVKGKAVSECVRLVPEIKQQVVEPGQIIGVTWLLEDLNGKGVIDNSHLTIKFGEDARFGGDSGCNQYSGSFTLEGPSLKVAPNIVSTMRACVAEAMMNQERAFLTTLPELNKAERVGTNGLLLSGADGKSLRFVAE